MQYLILLTSIKIVPLNVVYFLLIYCTTKTLYKKWLTFFDIVIGGLDEDAFAVGELVQGNEGAEDAHNVLECLEMDGSWMRKYEVGNHYRN